MRDIDVEDEGIIHGEAATVIRAVIDELSGKTHWWRPDWEAKKRGKTPIDQVGGMFDIQVHRGMATQFTARVCEVTDRRLRVEYVDGAYVGEGIWYFESVGNETRVGFHWHVQPHGWLRWFVLTERQCKMIGDVHHQVMQAGFERLDRFVQQREAASRG